MKTVITGFNVINAPQGTRLGFTYSEINDDGTTIKDNEKGSMIVLDDETLEHIDALKEHIINWIDNKD